MLKLPCMNFTLKTKLGRLTSLVHHFKSQDLDFLRDPPTLSSPSNRAHRFKSQDLDFLWHAPTYQTLDFAILPSWMPNVGLLEQFLSFWGSSKLGASFQNSRLWLFETCASLPGSAKAKFHILIIMPWPIFLIFPQSEPSMNRCTVSKVKIVTFGNMPQLPWCLTLLGSALSSNWTLPRAWRTFSKVKKVTFGSMHQPSWSCKIGFSSFLLMP